ncbi:MAG: hypothetical protein KatS3mg124_0611 [Porticoccaceae bacterium]|nr:MAG: hypothetical protein KatS3mg124_0611 [Porticoccaceae bacterium]
MTAEAADDLRLRLARSKAPAIARAAAILRLLGRSDTPLSLNAIARSLGLVPSTCLYVLRALVEEELVAFDPDTKRYSLEAGVLALARQWLRRNRFVELAQPLLDRLAEAYDMGALGVAITGLDHLVVVARAEPGEGFRLSAELGSRFPSLISATGRCLAAFGDYPRELLEARFAELRWDPPPHLRGVARPGGGDAPARLRRGRGALHRRGDGGRRPPCGAVQAA